MQDATSAEPQDEQESNLEETTPDTSQTPSQDAALQHEMTLEEALAALEKTRQERDAVQAAADKWKQHEDSQKTELQLVQEKLAAAEQQLAQERTTNTLLEVAAAHGIKAEDLPLLGTGTKEEITERAKRLQALYGDPTEAAPPPSQRPRQGLQSGQGTPSQVEDVAYPESWIPAALRTEK
nr:MAG TPA: protein of unknown function (DUF4355) [Caudoviricetes sp.]